jgi:hypothetical protein
LHVVPFAQMFGSITQDGRQMLRFCIESDSHTESGLRFWHCASLMQLRAQRKLDRARTHTLPSGHVDSPLQLAEQYRKLVSQIALSHWSGEVQAVPMSLNIGGALRQSPMVWGACNTVQTY